LQEAVLLPLAAWQNFYVVVGTAAALFVIAAAPLLLLFIGIHNAWDVVTYTAFERSRPQNTSQD
jgi:hypothetical protein